MNYKVVNALKLTAVSLVLAGCQCLKLECDIVLAEVTLGPDGDMMMDSDRDDRMMRSGEMDEDVATRFEVRNGKLYAASDSGALTVVSNKSFFGFDSAVLTNAAKRDLNTHALYLRKNPNRRVTVEGHTDERGPNEYNLTLGDRRALRVADYIRTRGVAGSQMRTVSYGEERPDDNRSNDQGWANNRRAVIVHQ